MIPRRRIHIPIITCAVLGSLAAISKEDPDNVNGVDDSMRWLDVKLSLDVTEKKPGKVLQILEEKYRQKNGTKHPMNFIAVGPFAHKNVHVTPITCSLSNEPLHKILRLLANATSSELRIRWDNTLIFLVGKKITRSETISIIRFSTKFFAATKLDKGIRKGKIVDWLRNFGIEFPPEDKITLHRSESVPPITLTIKNASETEIRLAQNLIKLVERGNTISPDGKVE